MSVKHWIITNRKVESSRGRDRVVEDSHDPLPTFRIANFAPLATGSALSDDRLRNAVSFIPDDFIDRYQDVTADSNPSDFIASKRLFLALYQAMSAGQPGKGDTLVFIHGFNYAWTDALSHLQRLHEVYVEPPESPIGQILYFTWPSLGRTSMYLSDQQIALPSGMLLGRVFSKAVQFYRDFFKTGRNAPEFCGKRIHLAAHSMGNQVLREFMRTVREQNFLRSSIFGETLLINADLEWTGLETGHPLASLPDYSDRVHVYNHASDDALAISEATKNDAKRLGRHGPRDWREIPPRNIVVDCSALSADTAGTPDNRFSAAAKRVLGGRPAAIRERMFDHWGYLHREEVVADIYQVLHGTSASNIQRRDKRDGPVYRLRPT